MICRNLIYILFSVLIFSLPTYAIEKASVKYEENMIDYSVLNGKRIMQEADSFFEQYEATKNPQYLSTAMGKYYILTKIYPVDMYPTVQLARTYDESKLDRFAKSYFDKGFDINKQDPYLNYYFGDFYYKRNDFKRAMRFYKRAYDFGYNDFYDLNFKIATIYEKFADLVNAKYYYEKAYSLNPSNDYLKDKALQIRSLDYEKSEYYHYIRK